MKSYINLKYTLPILLASLCIFIMGTIPFTSHENLLSFLGKLIYLTCGLWWVINDSRERKVRLPNWLKIMTFLFQPFGMLIWFYETWKWKIYIPVIIYLIIIILLFVIYILGYVTAGLICGYPLNEILNQI
jgi:hypothetical protein